MNETEKMVYLCYEVNNHQLALECGAVNEIKAFCSINKTVEWVLERVKCGTDDCYIVDAEYGDVTPDRLLYELTTDGCIDITLFNGYQENWDVSYDVIVRKVEVK